jgi:hypothetical protein
MSRATATTKKKGARTAAKTSNASDAALQKDAKTGRFLPGNSGFGGRPKGARSKLSTEFFDDLYETWQQHGAVALKKMAIDDPKDFVRVTAQLMPKEFEIKRPVEELGDAELADLIAVVQQLAEQVGSEGADAPTAGGERAASKPH